MLKRNFNNESLFNFLIRGARAFFGRARGKLLSGLNLFKNKPKNLYLGSLPRFMNSQAIKLGDNVKIGIAPRIEVYPDTDQNQALLEIGNNCSFGDYLHIGCINNIKIGEFVLGGSNILITDHSHGIPKSDLLALSKTPPIARLPYSKAPIFIGKNVWICDGAIILAGADIGEGAVIPANTVVRGSVPPFTIYTGEK